MQGRAKEKVVFWEIALTTTAEYVVAATASNLILNAKDKSLKTPPRQSMSMKVMEMPMTSLCL